MLLGKHSKEDLQQAPYATWFNKNYTDYTVDSATGEQLRPLVKEQQFEIFMGTWCGDSKREVPRMLKLLEYAGVPPSHIKMIMVDNHDSTYKQSPGHEERGKNIHRVPDLIVYSKGIEVNRIVESPVVSLEKDLLSITTGSAYQPNYKAAACLAKLAADNNTVALTKDSAHIIALLKPLVQSSAEINTLGYVWMAGNEMEKALLAFELNASLFPATANVYSSLGEINMRMNRPAPARQYLQQALHLEPANEQVKKMLEKL